MKIEVLADPEAAARRAAAFIAGRAHGAVEARGVFTLALSGGRTPRRMLQLLAAEDLPWAAVHVFQTDERVVAAADSARNLAPIRDLLGARLMPPHLHGMPVEAADLAAAAARYGRDLAEIAGTPPVLDVIHLGLGADGHAASLVRGDAAVDIEHADVAIAGPYQGTLRMTLTRPILDRARCLLWLVTGADKAAALARLLAGDASIPAARISSEGALVVADAAARTAN